MRDSPRRLEDLEGASKRKRLDKINESGILESKRFLLSPDPILRERPRILADIIERLRIKHPEIIGVVFGGSYVKGYANSKSDLDASIFIDEDSVRDAAGTNDPDEKTEKLQYFLDIRKHWPRAGNILWNTNRGERRNPKSPACRRLMFAHSQLSLLSPTPAILCRRLRGSGNIHIRRPRRGRRRLAGTPQAQ